MRQNPHVRICGGPGSATTLVYPTEPDPSVWTPGTRPPWRGYDTLHELLQTLRPCLSRHTEAAQFSWFLRMDPQIAEAFGTPAWIPETWRGRLEEYRNNGDEIGLHTHAWRFCPCCQRWLEDFSDQQWVEQCVRVSFDAYADAFGTSCHAFRFGSRWLSSAAPALLEQLGVRYELTVEPGRLAQPPFVNATRVTAWLPSYRGVPRMPYRPSRFDFRKPDAARTDGPWMIPLSTVRKSLGPLRGVLHGLLRRTETLYRSGPGNHGVSSRLARTLARCDAHTTLMMGVSPEAFRRMVERILGTGGAPYLAISMRASSGDNSQSVRNVTENFNYLLSSALLNRLVFVTPREALARLGLGANLEPRHSADQASA